MKLSFSTLSEMTVLSFRNAIQLHLDSWLLYKNKSYSTAYYISVMAMEEFGKMKKLNIQTFYTGICDNVGFTDKEFEDSFEEIRSHPFKQQNAIVDHVKFDENSGKITAPKQYEHILEDSYNKAKENSIYVGIKKSKRGRESIINPLNVTKETALKQIAIVQEIILEDILMVKKLEHYYDTMELTYYLCKHGMRIYKKLRNLKIPISKEAEKHFRELEKYPTVTRAHFY